MRRSVEEFTYTSPLEYPGQRNDRSYLLDGGREIVSLDDNIDVVFSQIDGLLSDRGLPLIADRVPVVAYGRNASPSGVATKNERFKYGTISVADLATVPVVRGELHGLDVVWHGRPGQIGGYFAELLKSEDTRNTIVEAWLQFLTNEQLAALHVTEGETYQLSSVEGVTVGDTVSIDAVGYTARSASLRLDSANGRPISVAGISRIGSELEVLNGREMLEATLGLAAVQDALGSTDQTPESYIQKGREMNLSQRKARQRTVEAVLLSLGLIRPYTFDVLNYYGRADFNSLPRGKEGRHQSTTVYHLMEQDIAAMRPDAEVLRCKASDLRKKYPGETELQLESRAREIIDPANAIRRWANKELADPRRLERLEAWRGGLSAIKYDTSYNEQGAK